MDNVTGPMLVLYADTLALLGGKVGRKKLREALPGWTEEQYNEVETRLIEAATIKIGRGRGGSVEFR